ncbi:MAG: hypothetical protein K9J06_14750 [Flavobacteriales bacterium]|nr:hypothetical protein [Flavobacteriales bacterium]
MPVNFFQPGCRHTTEIARFGLCDDPQPAKSPAYLDEIDPDKWIAEVSNPGNRAVEFHAVDHCPGIDPRRTDGSAAQRCDGILTWGRSIVFVELKDRARGFGGGQGQLLETIRYFNADQGLGGYDHVRAHVANRQRPAAAIGGAQTIQTFRNETAAILGGKGVDLCLDRNIQVS